MKNQFAGGAHFSKAKVKAGFLICLCSVSVLYAARITMSEWDRQFPPLTGNHLVDVYFVDQKTGWAVGKNGTIVATTDSGKTWFTQIVPRAEDLSSVYFCNSRKGWAVGGTARACVFFTEDGGANWVMCCLDPLLNPCTKVFFADSLHGWIISADSLLIETVDGGNNWKNRFFEDGPSHIYDFSFANDSLGFLIGNSYSFVDSGYIMKTIDKGATWTHISSDLGLVNRQIQMLDDTIAYCAGEIGIIKTIDGGKSWNISRIFSNPPVIKIQMHFLDSDNGLLLYQLPYAVGTIVAKTTDGGKSWHDSAHSELLNVNKLFYPSPAWGIAVTNNGGIYRINGLAESIKEISKPAPDMIAMLDFCDSLHGCALGRTNGNFALLTTDNGGTTWKENNFPVSNFILYFNKSSNSAYFYSTLLLVLFLCV